MHDTPPSLTRPDAAADPMAIRPLAANEALARLGELAAILVDVVAHGASVNFLAGFSLAEGEAFWRGQLPGLADGSRQLFVAEAGGRLVGTVVLTFAQQPNAPHRAEIGKMLVHSSMRRRGLGKRLLGIAEAAAKAAGRSLLVLDTQTGSAGDLLYRHCGWTEVGTIPDHSLTPDGRLAPATIFCKRV